MMKLLLATTNPGKVKELTRLLDGIPAQPVSLRDLSVTDSVEETGTTFEENALLKARFFHKLTGLAVIADDGGFEIDALGGEPGVKSHRWPYGDREATDEELISYTLERMKHVQEGDRGAQLRVVIAFVAEGVEKTAEAAVRGVIPLEPSRKREPGYPYRSLLFLPGIGKFYQHDALSRAENDRYNHRKQAIAKLAPVIIPYLTKARGAVE